MNIRRKLMIASIMIAIVLLCLLSFKIEFTTENVIISDETISQLVYADTVDLMGVEAEVVFSLSDSVKETEKRIDNLETTMIDAYALALNECIAEQQKKLEEERLRKEEEERKAAELAAYREQVGNTYNPFTITGLTVEQFNVILAGTGLEGCGQSYYNMEQTYGVNGVFAISVAFHESGYGKYRANTNNFYGMRGNNGWMAFESPDANIMYFGKLMNKSMYYGKSILGIGKVYCPGTHTSWANAVQGMMDRCYKKI